MFISSLGTCLQIAGRLLHQSSLSSKVRSMISRLELHTWKRNDLRVMIQRHWRHCIKRLPNSTSESPGWAVESSRKICWRDVSVSLVAVGYWVEIPSTFGRISVGYYYIQWAWSHLLLPWFGLWSPAIPDARSGIGLWLSVNAVIVSPVMSVKALDWPKFVWLTEWRPADIGSWLWRSSSFQVHLYSALEVSRWPPSFCINRSS